MLTSIESESVSDISDTPDSLMCVDIANRAFEEISGKYLWKHLRRQGALIAGSQINELKGATGTYYIDPNSVYYDSVLVTYKTPDEFFYLTQMRDTSESNVTTINNIKVLNDTNPTYFTTFDETTLVFDSIPTGAGLVAASSDAIYYQGATARKSSNSDVFDFPARLYYALTKYCIAMCKEELAGDDSAMAAARREIESVSKNTDLLQIRKTVTGKVPTRRTSAPSYSNVTISEV